jgi:hypothetical protein
MAPGFCLKKVSLHTLGISEAGNRVKPGEIVAKRSTIVFAVVELPNQGALTFATRLHIEWAFCPQVY